METWEPAGPHDIHPDGAADIMESDALQHMLMLIRCSPNRTLLGDGDLAQNTQVSPTDRKKGELSQWITHMIVQYNDNYPDPSLFQLLRGIGLASTEDATREASEHLAQHILEEITRWTERSPMVNAFGNKVNHFNIKDEMWRTLYHEGMMEACRLYRAFLEEFKDHIKFPQVHLR